MDVVSQRDLWFWTELFKNTRDYVEFSQSFNIDIQNWEDSHPAFSSSLASQEELVMRKEMKEALPCHIKEVLDIMTTKKFLSEDILKSTIKKIWHRRILVVKKKAKQKDKARTEFPLLSNIVDSIVKDLHQYYVSL